MICSDWVHINHHEKDNLPGMKPSGQASPDESHIGDADTKCERSEQGWGSGGSPPEKFMRPHPSDRWKMPLFVKKSPLKGAVELD